MPAELHLVAESLPGRLWIMPHPKGSEDIAGYVAAGMTRVVSMLAKAEAASLGLAQEEAFCRARGLAFSNHPIADFGLPEPDAFTDLIGQIAAWLKAGEAVGVHCRAGIGRSGMVTAGLLIHLGQSADAAIAQVSRARGVSIPDTVEQGRYLAAFAKGN